MEAQILRIEGVSPLILYLLLEALMESQQVMFFTFTYLYM